MLTPPSTRLESFCVGNQGKSKVSCSKRRTCGLPVVALYRILNTSGTCSARTNSHAHCAIASLTSFRSLLCKVGGNLGKSILGVSKRHICRAAGALSRGISSRVDIYMCRTTNHKRFATFFLVWLHNRPCKKVSTLRPCNPYIQDL